jgi:hypothetical protein
MKHIYVSRFISRVSCRLLSVYGLALIASEQFASQRSAIAAVQRFWRFSWPNLPDARFTSPAALVYVSGLASLVAQPARMFTAHVYRFSLSHSVLRFHVWSVDV